jgi:hypothetical protein
MSTPSPALSAASLERQIAREGERWGLVPETDPKDGRTRVVEVTPQAETRHGVTEVVRRANRRICTVNEDAPFSEALRNRIDNGEVDLARRMKLADELEAKAKREREEAEHHEALAFWRTRRRITALPTGIVPAGLTNRRTRR